ncbi:MAG TPA: chorismate synthase [Candidatus Limnocylindria bacterium]|nr:chorismate synthase [Candidatus Limnocylindria bacterium]
MIRFLTAGESHGPELTVIVDGFPAGLALDGDRIDAELRRRQGGYGRGARSTKIERDHAEITGGIAKGVTTGAPIALRIVNRDFANQPAEPAPLTAPRPGHADLAGNRKYGGDDLRAVRERASARETAGRVAAGAIAKQLLEQLGIETGSFVTAIGDVDAGVPPLSTLRAPALRGLAAAAEANDVRTPDESAVPRMRAAIDRAKETLDTIGGVFVVFATGLPAGLGSHVQWDRRLGGRIALAIGSIHAIKGVEIGDGFAAARLPGSRAQDAITRDGASLARASNHAGGLEGGMTNGEPLIVRAAMKPLSSVRSPVASVDLASGTASDAPYVRSDVCAVPAAAVVGEAMVAWVLLEAVLERYGGDRLDLICAARERDRPAPLP